MRWRREFLKHRREEEEEGKGISPDAGEAVEGLVGRGG